MAAQNKKVQKMPPKQQNLTKKKTSRKKTPMKKSTRTILIAAASVVLVAAAGFLLFWFASGSHAYSVALAEGLEYYDQGDYENAIIAYEKAVEADPESEEAVMGLAKAYIQIKDYIHAKEALRKGIARIGETDTLITFLEKLNYEYFGIGEAAVYSGGEIKTMSQDVALNSGNWNAFGTLTYKEFKKKYRDSVAGSDSGTPTLSSSTAQQVLYYSDSESLDSSGKPMNNAYPGRIELLHLSAAFDNFEGAVSYDKLKTLFGGQVKKQKDNRLGCTAVYLTYRDNVLVVACDDSGNIVSESAPNYLLPDCDALRMCEISGQVTDATTKKAVEAKLTFTPTSAGASSTETIESSKSSGTYSVELNPGNYKVSVTADDYITAETTLSVGEDDLSLTKNFSLSPKLKNGEIRLVLEWGSKPKDLDCYLRDLNSNSIIIKYSKKTKQDSSGLIATLDVDDRDGYGPETVTIYRTSGNYELFINDFMVESSTSVQNSGATVTVYIEGQSPEVIAVPKSQSGNIWHVCKINNGVLTVINEMRTESTTPANK